MKCYSKKHGFITVIAVRKNLKSKKINETFSIKNSSIPKLLNTQDASKVVLLQCMSDIKINSNKSFTGFSVKLKNGNDEIRKRWKSFQFHVFGGNLCQVFLEITLFPFYHHILCFLWAHIKLSNLLQINYWIIFETFRIELKGKWVIKVSSNYFARRGYVIHIENFRLIV